MWTHRAYRARFPMRVLLMLGHTIGLQWTIHSWVKAHRTHHKFVDTDADPHNVKRGFLFSHIGWMLRKEHPLVAIKGAQIDMSDIENDPVVMFNYKYIWELHLLFALFLPLAVAVFLLQEPLVDAIIITYCVRVFHSAHCTFFINSAAHMFGERPYNGKIASAENTMVSVYACGEGYHNYHHHYPWDYGAGETGNSFNFAKLCIDLGAKLGQAYKLKQATPEMIAKSRASRNAHANESIEQEF